MNPNILPYEGEVIYFGNVLSKEEARMFFDVIFRKAEWKNDEVIIFGKKILTRRKTAWYGDEGCVYRYSGLVRQPLPWFPELLRIRDVAQASAGTNFNSCLLNLYHDGNDGMSWHSDDERMLGKDIVIASVSLGAERDFGFRHKTSREKIIIKLENGSLLIMKGDTQFNWHHALPKSKKVKEPRINLTFRKIIPGS